MRQAIEHKVVTHRFFEPFAATANPPYHIIVHDSVVSLVGVVQSRIERIKMESIARQTPGVLVCLLAMPVICVQVLPLSEER